MKRRSVAQPDYSSDRPGGFTRNSENSKANRIETMKGPAESGQICSVGRRKIAKKIAKNKRCYANTLRPRSRMLLKVMKGGVRVGHYPLGHLRRGVIIPWVNLSVTGTVGRLAEKRHSECSTRRCRRRPVHGSLSGWIAEW